MKKNLTNFAENIYKLRNDLNKSQSQFADYISQELKKNGIKFDYSNKSISKWESADSIPSMEVLIVLSRLLNTTIDTLLKDKIEVFQNVKVDSDKEQIIERFKKFPNVYTVCFDREISVNYGILGQMAQSICHYYDKEYITDEDLAENIVISCPYAVADFDKKEIKKLELLNDPILTKIEKSNDYVKDTNNRTFSLRLNRKKLQDYTFKNYNMYRMMMFSESTPMEKMLNDFNVENFAEFRKLFLSKIDELKKECDAYEECGLLEEAGIDFGVDFENKKIMFYLTGNLKLSIDELSEIWKSIGANRFYNFLKFKIAKSTAKEYLGDLLE